MVFHFSTSFVGFGRKSYICCTVFGTQFKAYGIWRSFRLHQENKGEQVVIRRRGKVSYMLTPVYENDFILSPEFENRLEEGRRQYRARNVTVCTTKEELDKFLESL